MKINNLNNISFQKTLVAKCKIGNKNATQDANIYLLDERKDFSSFARAKMYSFWDDSFYIGDIATEFLESNPNKYFYMMEDEQARPICFSMLDRKKAKSNKLRYIETAPKLSIYDKPQQKRYIGETMLAFLTKICQKDGRNLLVPEVAPRLQTEDYYFKHCKFEEIQKQKNEYYKKAILRQGMMDEFLELNKSHTGSSINIVA